MEQAKKNSRKPVTLADLHIIDKKQGIVPLKLKRIQQHLLDNLTGRDLVVKSRQPGVSTAVQSYLFCEAVNKTARIGVMAHDDETTQKLRDMQQLFYDELSPDRKPERAINNATRVYYPSTKSLVYIGTAGNTTRGRGGTYSHFHGSEVAFWRNADYLLAGVLQGVPMDGQIILESTANGATGWFYDEVKKSLEGDSVFTVHFYPWFWDEDCVIPGEHDLEYTDEELRLIKANDLSSGQIAWRRYKKKELGWLFDQEYPEDVYTAFLTSGNGVFGNFDHALYTPPADDKWQEGHYYIAGLDWGQQDDYTALSIIDCDDNREVYLNRWNKSSWQTIRKSVLDACELWHVNELYPESNSIGMPNIEALEIEMNERSMKMDIVPYSMTNDRKASMVATLYTSIHEHGFKLLDVKWAADELRMFVSKQTPLGAWTYGGDNGSHDDGVVCRMSARFGVSRRI